MKLFIWLCFLACLTEVSQKFSYRVNNECLMKMSDDMIGSGAAARPEEPSDPNAEVTTPAPKSPSKKHDDTNAPDIDSTLTKVAKEMGKHVDRIVETIAKSYEEKLGSVCRFAEDWYKVKRDKENAYRRRYDGGINYHRRRSDPASYRAYYPDNPHSSVYRRAELDSVKETTVATPKKESKQEDVDESDEKEVKPKRCRCPYQDESDEDNRRGCSCRGCSCSGGGRCRCRGRRCKCVQ